LRKINLKQGTFLVLWASKEYERRSLRKIIGEKMDTNQKSFSVGQGLVAFALIAALAAGVLAFAAFVSPRSFTLTTNTANQAGITVTGTATVHAVPDLATVSFGITAAQTTIKLARANMAAAANRVLDNLHAQGIAEADIVTSNISLYQQSLYNNPGVYNCPLETPVLNATLQPATSSSSGGVSSSGLPVPAPINSDKPQMPPATPQSPSVTPAPNVSTDAPTILPYCAGNSWVYSETLTVTIRNLDNASEVIDGAIGAGANSLNGLSFDVSNRSKLEETARTNAIKQAHDQAASMAQAAGAELGSPLSINASFYGGPLDYKAAPMAAGSTSSTPVSPGTMDVTATVTIVYALK
jgi:uncharacterized protein YggE